MIDYLLPVLMWNVVILFFIEGYLELTISVFVDWRYFKYDNFSRHSLLSHTVSLVFGIALILFPLFVYWFFRGVTE